MKKIISIALIAVLALALLAGCGSSAAPATTTAPASEAPAELRGTGDVITTVSTNPDAIGYASLAALKDNVKALTVGGIAPTEDTVKDGSYVIQRPFVLVTKDGAELSAAAQAFFDYATSADAADLTGEGTTIKVTFPK